MNARLPRLAAAILLVVLASACASRSAFIDADAQGSLETDSVSASVQDETPSVRRDDLLSVTAVRPPRRTRARAADEPTGLTSDERAARAMQEREANLDRDNALARSAVRSVCTGC